MNADTEREITVQRYLQDLQEIGRASKTLEAYERVLTNFADFVEHQDGSIKNPSRKICLSWYRRLQEQYSESTVASYVLYVNSMYRYLMMEGVVESNPMQFVASGSDEQIDSQPDRREISIEQMATFIDSINHPLDKAVIMTLVKTGIRVGELCNIDCRDLSLDGAREICDLRKEIDDSYESLYAHLDRS